MNSMDRHNRCYEKAKYLIERGYVLLTTDIDSLIQKLIDLEIKQEKDNNGVSRKVQAEEP